MGAGAPSFVAVLGVRRADFGDGGDRDAQDPHAAADVVLGGVSGRYAPSRDLGQAVAAPARSVAL